jgi:predicted ferric reductase
MIAFGRLFGLCLQLGLLVQLILISRLPFVEREYGFDKLNRAHRTLGYVLTASVICHPLLLITGYSLASGVPGPAQFMEFWTTWPHVPLAVIALVLFLTIGFFSIPRIRRWFKYGTWHLTHLLAYLAVGLAFKHQFNSEDVSAPPAYYYWYALNFSVFAILLFHRFIRPLVSSVRHRFVVEKVVPETHDVTSVYITGRDMDRFTFDPGQFIHVSFQAKGYREPHPFSLSMAPNGRQLRLSIKNSGDFTSRIKDLRPGTEVILEGPFGRFTERAAKGSKYLFIAGGIGITPIRSMLESLSAKKADAVLLYGNKTPEDVVFRDELDRLGVRRHDVINAYIDEAKIRSLVPDFAERDIYVCGPPAMMDKLVAMFRGFGVPRERIHFEKFSY